MQQNVNYALKCVAYTCHIISSFFVKFYAILLTPFTKRNIFILQYVLIFDNECKKICVWRKKLDYDFLSSLQLARY